MEGACWSLPSISALKMRKRRRRPNLPLQDVPLDLQDLLEPRDQRVTWGYRESVDPKEKRGKSDAPVQRAGQELQDSQENRASQVGRVQRGLKERRATRG